MEQETRQHLEDHVAECRSVLERIEAAWVTQTRRPTADQVNKWIEAGRE